MKIIMGRKVAVSEKFYTAFISCENACKIPFELKFDERKIEAFNYGIKCFETSEDFNRFEKVVITVTSKGYGEINASEYYHGNEIKDGFDCGAVLLGKGDRVEFTIKHPKFNNKPIEDFPYNGYNVYVYSTTEIDNIELDFGSIKEVLEIPVEELKLSKEIEKVIIVCEYCLNQSCNCGAEKWAIIKLPFKNIY